MKIGDIQGILWSIGLAGQLSLLGVLLYRRLYRNFPIFTAYLLYSSVADLSFFTVFRYWAPSDYFHIYFANVVPEFLFQIGILFEIARNTIAPVKRSLPKAALLVLAAMLLSGTALALFLSVRSSQAAFTRWWQLFLQISFTVAILRVVIFSAIALFAQMLGIGWKNHVLQIATGFAGYSIAILMVELLHRFAGSGEDTRYRLYEQIRQLGWCVSLGYWNYVLTRKEAPRKEFSPKMASFLVSLAEGARKNRATDVRCYRK